MVMNHYKSPINIFLLTCYVYGVLTFNRATDLSLLGIFGIFLSTQWETMVFLSLLFLRCKCYPWWLANNVFSSFYPLLHLFSSSYHSRFKWIDAWPCCTSHWECLGHTLTHYSRALLLPPWAQWWKKSVCEHNFTLVRHI